MGRRVLAVVDFSDVTEKVVQTAVEIATSSSDATLYLMHVAAPEPDFVGYDVGPASVRQDVAEDQRREHRELQRIAGGVKQIGLEVTPLLVQGPAVEKIVAEACHLKVDYLVLGSHGHGALYHALMGSVSSGVLRGAKCPVVVVPAG